MFVCGMRLGTGEYGEDIISLKLLPEYQNYTDIFCEEKINILPKHTNMTTALTWFWPLTCPKITYTH